MKATEPNYTEFHNELCRVWGHDSHMVEYCAKTASCVIMLSDGAMMVEFEQPRIESNFPFSYSTCGQGATWDEACQAERDCNANMQEYFMSENMNSARYDQMIESLNDPNKKLYLAIRYMRGQCLMHWLCIEPHRKEYPNPLLYKDYFLSLFQDSDKALILEAVKAERDKFQKRLNSWWKRYGAEKCRTWTWWVDE